MDGAVGGSVGTGGTSAVGGSSGGATVGATGGTTGGATTNQDCTTLRSFPNCGSPCSVTIEQHCVGSSGSRGCALDASKICTRFAFGSKWQRGCGYLRVEDAGDVGDRWINIWNETTGQLVYYWFSGKYSSGCVPEMSAGAEPTCSSWADACTDGGV